ncbi:MAG: VIT and VWA domain-containing protein [Elusimicrobiota bacterium]
MKQLRMMILTAAAALWTMSASAAGLLRPTKADYGDLEIRKHAVSIVINNGFAKTEVDQVFHNPHDQDLEAVYTFPVPEKAAMSELSLWVDGKEMFGEVLEKKKAREVYEDEKAKGRDTALNEKDGYKSFKVSVAPVRAGQDTRIRLVYYQPLKIDHGIGSYIYPLEEGGVDDARDLAFFLNDEIKGDGETGFTLDLKLKTAYPVDAVMVPSHPGASVVKENDGAYRVAVASGAGLGRDFVLNYRLAADQPADVELIPFKEKGAQEGTFMIVVTPGDDLKPLSRGADWTFVLDISGSMTDKLPALAEGVEKALTRMRPEDRFRIVLFNERAHWLIKPFTVANKENVAKAVGEVSALRAGGSTNLYQGLEQGLEDLAADRTSAVLLVTDGVANVGVTEHRRFIELARKKDVRLFTFIMGNSANTPLLKDLAESSNGFAAAISNADAIVGKILQAKSRLTHEAMHDAGIKIKGTNNFALTPAQPRTLYRGEQLVVFGKYRGHGKAQLTFEAKISGKPMTVTVPVVLPEADERNPELERLWALARVEELAQEKRLGGNAQELDGMIRDLGVSYSLVTDETSMVVVREESLVEHGIDSRNMRRIIRERAAQKTRDGAAPTSYARQYSPPPVSGSPAARIGSGGGGAVGPLFGVLAVLMAGLRRKRKQ